MDYVLFLLFLYVTCNGGSRDTEKLRDPGLVVHFFAWLVEVGLSRETQHLDLVIAVVSTGEQYPSRHRRLRSSRIDRLAR